LGLICQPSGGRVPHPLMAQAEEAFTTAKEAAQQVVATLNEASGAGSLRKWSPPPMPRDPVRPPPPLGHLEPPLALRMVWRIRDLWKAVATFKGIVHDGLQWLGRRDREIHVKDSQTALELLSMPEAESHPPSVNLNTDNFRIY